jgi:hypothetical protein
LIRVPDASLARTIDLGPLGAAFHFVNLTNGLEALPVLTGLGLPFQFTRCALGHLKRVEPLHRRRAVLVTACPEARYRATLPRA